MQSSCNNGLSGCHVTILTPCMLIKIMTSCEPTRCSAHHEDLRWRMIWGREALGHSYEQIAQELRVDKATVCRTVALFKATGQVSKKRYPADKAFRKLTTCAQLLVLHLVLELFYVKFKMNCKVHYFWMLTSALFAGFYILVGSLGS